MGLDRELLVGAIDMHVHAAPDASIRRLLDVEEAARQAEQAGMAGLVFKHHDYCTAPLAELVNKHLTSCRVFGSICLDGPVGGLNPEAVEHAAKLGARVVWMPTFSSHQDRSRRGGQGIRVVDDKGQLLEATRQILEIIREHQMVLATGHISRDETFAVVAAARAMGISRIVITHPMTRSFGANLDVEDQVALAEQGAYIEHCFVATMPMHDRVDPAAMAEAIRRVGPARCVMSTDFGQLHNPPPVEGLRMFIASMLRMGFAPEEVRTMVKDNPARLLGV